jgi:hypothetical protein
LLWFIALGVPIQEEEALVKEACHGMYTWQNKLLISAQETTITMTVEVPQSSCTHPNDLKISYEAPTS